MEKQKKTWNKIIGENIRRLRISHNETQAELGESIGYGSTTIANYESGERLPDRIVRHLHGPVGTSRSLHPGVCIHHVVGCVHRPVTY